MQASATMLGDFLKETSMVRKDLSIVFFLLLNSFSWFFVIPSVLSGILGSINVTTTQSLVIWGAYYASNIVSMIVGSILSKKIDRLKFLYFWIFLGTVASLLPALLSHTVINTLVISGFFGVSFGLGIPSCLAYFADVVAIEIRGRTSGIILFAVNLSALILGVLFGMFYLTTISIILSLWRGSGLIIILLKPNAKIATGNTEKTSIGSVLRNRSFTAYFVAWLVFYLISRFESPILQNIFSSFNYKMIGPVIGSFFVLIGGFLCDRIGRKRVVIYGFVTLGIAYAIIGIFPAGFFSSYFFIFVESISTGMLMVAFVLILWGDLFPHSNKEQSYAIGEIPLFLADMTQLFSTPYIALIPMSRAFSVASFFLFLVVLPLIYAPETLPQRKIELGHLKKYVEAAKRTVEQYADTSIKA
jgi:MFS family permease